MLDAEEDFDDDLADGGHDYADLAAAMGPPEEEAHSDEEEDEGSASELGSGDHAMPSEDEEEETDLNDDDSAGSGDSGMSGSDVDESNQEVDDELNPFELAEATDSEDEPVQKGSAFRPPSQQAFQQCMYLRVLVCFLHLPGPCFVG